MPPGKLADSLYLISVRDKNEAVTQRDLALNLQKLANQRKDTAEFYSRLSYGLLVASIADASLRSGEIELAWPKPFMPWIHLLKPNHLFRLPVSQTFGHAVFLKFGKALEYVHSGGIIDITSSPDGKYIAVQVEMLALVCGNINKMAWP